MKISRPSLRGWLTQTATALGRAIQPAPVLHEATLARAQYEALAQAVPGLVGIVDRSFRLVAVGGRTERYSGCSVADINADFALSIVHPDDRHYAADARGAIAANAPFCCDLRLRRADGVYRPHHLRAIPVAGAGDEPAQWIFTATDIGDIALSPSTHSVHAHSRPVSSARGERAESTGIREANRLLLMVEELACVGHYQIDLASNDVYWSNEIYRTYGLPTTAKPTLEWVFSAYHPDDRDRIIEITRQALTDGRSFTFKTRIIRPEGEIRAVLAHGQVERTSDGRIIGLFGVLQDVTNLEAINRERDRLSERVMLATKAGKIGIWEWNVGGNRLEWDSAMYALYGIDDRSRVAAYETWIDCIHPADRGRAVGEIGQALDGTPFDTEFRVIWPAGDVRHLHSMGTLLDDPAGTGARMVGATWDITEVQALADDLREEKERAEQASRAKSDFVASMSHEIRTPMNGIIGFTTLVLDGELSAEQRRHVMLLRDAGRSLLAIINDILDFSKLEAGKIDLENIPLSLNALVDGALSIVRNEALPKSIKLVASIDSDVPSWVTGDPTRLRQTLLNLLTNALKFTERGAITVGVRRAREFGDNAIRFDVSDTGIGIAPEQRGLLFRDFSQIEKSTTRRYGGTGLGLAICKRLVEAMGGTIDVQSESGIGSTFWFTARLPEVAAPVTAAANEVDARVEPHRILVADDNRVNQIVVRNLLARDGHDVVIVEDGRAAVAAVLSGDFDMVLMDMQMPLMDGLEATRTIRAAASGARDVPIVALTANAMAEQVELCHAAGMNDHLAKPIDRELLRRAIARWARERAVTPQRPAPDVVPRVEPAWDDSPTIGMATLLDVLDGDLSAVREILDSALGLIDVDRARIATGIGDGDGHTVVEAAHRMKGTSGSIRSQRIMQISAAIQHAAHAAGAEVDPVLLRDLDAAIAQFRVDFAAYREFLTPALR